MGRYLFLSLMGLVFIIQQEVSAGDAMWSHRGDIPLEYNQARQLVSMLYRAILFREPDPGGLNTYMQLAQQQGYPGFIRSAEALISSREFYQNVYSIYPASQILRNIYFVFYQREVDPLGQSTWTPMIQHGQGKEMIRMVVCSPEFLRRHVRSNYFFNRQQAEQLVWDLYRGLLFRAADAQGLNQYTQQVMRQGYEGLIQIAIDLGQSREFFEHVDHVYSPRQILDNAMRVLIGRYATAVERQVWLPTIEEGHAAIIFREIVGSYDFISARVLYRGRWDRP